MEPVNLFKLAAQQAHWLAARQSTVAGNIANANTPGYATRDVVPFEAVLDSKVVTMRATHPRHVSMAPSGAGVTIEKFDEKAPMLPSGNTVVLEKELMRAGEVRRSFELNTAIVKTFHRMMMMTTRT